MAVGEGRWPGGPCFLCCPSSTPSPMLNPPLSVSLSSYSLIQLMGGLTFLSTGHRVHPQSAQTLDEEGDKEIEGCAHSG